RTIQATETLSQSVRYSHPTYCRGPFERPVLPLRPTSGERSAVDVRLQSTPERIPTRQGRRRVDNNEVRELHDARIQCNRRAERGGLPFTGHGGRVRKGSPVRALFCFSLEYDTREESGSVSADQHLQSERPSRCVGVPGRGDGAAHSAVRRPARNGAAVAGFSAPCERSGQAKGRFPRQIIELLTIELARLFAG